MKTEWVKRRNKEGETRRRRRGNANMETERNTEERVMGRKERKGNIDPHTPSPRLT